jgi:hypothetical protein
LERKWHSNIRTEAIFAIPLAKLQKQQQRAKHTERPQSKCGDSQLFLLLHRQPKQHSLVSTHDLALLVLLAAQLKRPMNQSQPVLRLVLALRHLRPVHFHA